MGMGKQIAKGVGYSMAPKLTFAALNPKKAAMGKAAAWAMDRMAPHRRRRSRNRGAIGLGAAAMAIPIGLWLGRRFMESRARDDN